MEFITFILFFILVVLTMRMVAVKREVKKMTDHLRKYRRRKTGQKLEMALFDRDLESLGEEINRLIDLYTGEQRKRVRFEKKQKQMIANISHDLRTPLTSIIGYLQMAGSDGISCKERRELLSVAAKQAGRLELLMNDFFELSLIEAPDYHLSLENINIKNILIDCLVGIYDQFREKNLELSAEIPEHHVMILANESAVIRVIENLLANAVQHADGNIEIVLEEHEQDVRLVVKNDALSITEQDVDRMFDRFYMADRARSGKSKGLGLSIVKSFMEKMNGTVTVSLDNGKFAVICEWKKIPTIKKTNSEKS